MTDSQNIEVWIKKLNVIFSGNYKEVLPKYTDITFLEYNSNGNVHYFKAFNVNGEEVKIKRRASGWIYYEGNQRVKSERLD